MSACARAAGSALPPRLGDRGDPPENTTMKKTPWQSRSLLHASLVAAFLWSLVSVVNAAEIKALSSAGVKGVSDELTPRFEQSSGHQVGVSFEVAAVLKRRIEAGEAFDVTVLTAPLIEDLIKQGKVAAGTRVDIAHTGLGIAVRKGAPKLDVSTPEALKATLLNAKSIAYSKEGASGQQFAAVLQRLGIADELQAKGRFILNPSPIEVAARGEAEIGVRLISEILLVPGADLVGPLPKELQAYVVLTGAVSANAKEPEAAAQWLKFLTTSAAAPVIRAKGMEPGAAP